MNISQIRQAMEIARSDKDLSNVDDSCMYGCALPGFKPCYITLEHAAKFIRWQTFQFNGGIDTQELNDNVIPLLKKKFLLV